MAQSPDTPLHARGDIAKTVGRKDSVISQNNFSPSMPKRAMVLAAGLGKRIRSVADGKPKPLIEVKGKALLGHVLDRLLAAGIEEVVVNVHYQAEMIEAYLKSHYQNRLIIHISDERKTLLDTGGGVLKALPFFRNEPFFTLNGKLLWEEEEENVFSRLWQGWQETDMLARLLLIPRAEAHGYEGEGDFCLGSEGKIRRYQKGDPDSYVYSGIQLLHPALFQKAPEGAFSMNLLWDRAIQDNRLFGLTHKAFWMHVSTPEALMEAERITTDQRREDRA